MSVQLNDEIRKKLNIKRNVPQLDWFRYSGVIATPPKFGKTTLAALIPNSIIIACEEGYDSIDADFIRIRSWDEFIELIDTLEDNIDTIGEELKIANIDTIHELWHMVNEYMLNQINRKQRQKGNIGVETLAQYDFRNGLTMRDEEWRKQFSRLTSLGIKPIFLSHLVMKKIKPEDGDDYHSLELDFDDNLYNLVVKNVDYILIGQNIREKDENGDISVKRKFVSKNDGVIKGGSRVHFGEDIYFDSEQEFLDKFQEIFKETVMSKNKINKTTATKMIKEAGEKLKEQRKNIAETNTSKQALIDEIKKELKDSKPSERRKILDYMLETYGDDKASILKTLEVEQLENLLNKINKD